MNRFLGAAALFAVIGLGAAGCQSTGQGMAQDAQKDAAAVDNAAATATKGVRQAASNASNEAHHAAAAAANGVRNTADAAATDVRHAGEAVRHTAGNAGAAVGLTPRVKNAIVADPKLNDTRNHINVDSTDAAVYLKGHVISAEEKQRASSVAEQEMKKAGAHQKLVNELSVG